MNDVFRMDVIEDRPLRQELAGPEIRALLVEIDGVKERVESLQSEMDRRLSHLETYFRLHERISLLEVCRKDGRERRASRRR